MWSLLILSLFLYITVCNRIRSRPSYIYIAITLMLLSFLVATGWRLTAFFFYHQKKEVEDQDIANLFSILDDVSYFLYFSYLWVFVTQFFKASQEF